MSGKIKVIFPAVLQALCRLTTVLSPVCWENWAADHIRDTALPHCFSKAPHAELPVWNKTHNVPRGTARPVVWGGTETIHGWQQGKHLISKSLGVEWKPVSCTPRSGAISQAETVPQPAKQWQYRRAQVVLGSPFNLLPSPVNGTEARLRWVLLPWGGTEPSLPSTYGCAFLSFTALMLYGLQEFYTPENSSSCKDTTWMPHEQNCRWNRNWNWALDTC